MQEKRQAKLNAVVYRPKEGESVTGNLVLLHGWGNSLETLLPLAKMFHRRFASWQVFVIDLPGHGKSAMPQNEEWGSREFANEVRDYLREEKVTKAVFLGHSFGGKVSLLLAKEEKELVQKVILVGSAGLAPKRTLKKKIFLFYVKILGLFYKKIDSLFGMTLFQQKVAARYGSADYKKANPLMRKILGRVIREDFSSMCSSLEQEFLLLWGQEDNETPIDMAMRFSKLLKKSQLVIYPHKGHHPFEDVGYHLLLKSIFPFVVNVAKREAI